MSSAGPRVAVQNILHDRVKDLAVVREAHGWELPVSSPQDIALALKAAHVARPDDLPGTMAALQRIGREGTWIAEVELREIVRRTGSTMKYVGWQRDGFNEWLANVDRYVAQFGQLNERGYLTHGGLEYVGGRMTAIILAGDDFILSPWVLAHAFLANARIVAKPSSVEPLSAFLFARAALEKGLSVPALLYLDTSSEDEVAALVDVVGRAEQSIVFGEDQTVRTVYRRAQASPPHRAIPYWSGRSGAIVLPDADLAAAAIAIVHGATADRGNKCISTKKVFAPRALAQELERRLVEAAGQLRRGSPLDLDTDIGQLSADARELAGRAIGASTVLYDRDLMIVRCGDDGSTLLREELPYPVVGIRYYEDGDDVVALANASVKHAPSRRALNIAVFTASRSRFDELARRLVAFKVIHNSSTASLSPLGSHQGIHLFRELMWTREVV